MFCPKRSGVANKEFIGRRIFGDKIWDSTRSNNRVRTFRWDHFYDERLVKYNNTENGLSFDRIGVASVDQEVLARIRPAAEAQGRALVPERPFKGWAVLSVEEVKKCLRIFSLESGLTLRPDPYPENPFHALLRSDCYTTKKEGRAIATALAHIATLPPCDGLVGDEN